MRERLVVFSHDGMDFTPDPESLTLVHHYVGESKGVDDDPLPHYIIIIVAVAAGLSVLSVLVALVSNLATSNFSNFCLKEFFNSCFSIQI